jgi:Cu(I)/Ag(I) efflux system protein CusF
MKTILVGFAIAALGLSAHAAESPDRGMAGMKMDAPAAAQVHKAVGVVKALDAAKGTVTIAHEPVPALQWSAMTMPFTLSAELAKGVQVGQKVNFEFTAKGMNGTITKIALAK